MQEDARALTLADLACTLLSILFAILVWLRRKKDGGEDADDEDEQVDEDVEEDEPRGLRCPENRECGAGGTVCGLVLPHAAACMAFPFGGLVDGVVRAAVRHGAGHAHLEAQTEENRPEEIDEENMEDFAE